jgi:hypothetical protein
VLRTYCRSIELKLIRALDPSGHLLCVGWCAKFGDGFSLLGGKPLSEGPCAWAGMAEADQQNDILGR